MSPHVIPRNVRINYVPLKTTNHKITLLIHLGKSNDFPSIAYNNNNVSIYLYPSKIVLSVHKRYMYLMLWAPVKKFIFCYMIKDLTVKYFLLTLILGINYPTFVNGIGIPNNLAIVEGILF